MNKLIELLDLSTESEESLIEIDYQFVTFGLSKKYNRNDKKYIFKLAIKKQKCFVQLVLIVGMLNVYQNISYQVKEV